VSCPRVAVAWVIVGGLLAVAACGGAGPTNPPAAAASPRASATSGATPALSPMGSQALATDVVVECGPGAPVLASGRVRASADGVRFVVTGQAGWMFGVTTNDGQAGNQLENRRAAFTWLVPPGDVGVSCADPSLPGAAPVTALRIEDPDGLYRPVALGQNASAGDCVTANVDYGEDARGKPGDPIELTRTAVDGLLAGDVVERGGYPVETGSVRIVRAGEVVGHVRYGSDGHGGWLPLGGTLCEGLSVDRW